MKPSRTDRLRAAAQLQQRMRREHGENADAAMAQAFAANSGSRAEVTYRHAMARNSSQRFTLSDANLPAQVLRPEETVHDVAVGGLTSDTFPLVIVTDQRVLHVRDKIVGGWTVLREAPAADVLGAEIEKRLLTGRLRVRLRQGKDITMGLAAKERPAEVAALINRLVSSGGAAS